MSSFFLLIALQVVSLLMCALGLRQLYRYIKRYRFSESQYSLLFGFMRLRYFMILYVVGMLWASFVAILLGTTFL